MSSSRGGLRGGRHVVVEKPLAMDGEAADRLVAVAAARAVTRWSRSPTAAIRWSAGAGRRRGGRARRDPAGPWGLPPGLAGRADRLELADRPDRGRAVPGGRRHRHPLVRHGRVHQRRTDRGRPGRPGDVHAAAEPAHEWQRRGLRRRRAGRRSRSRSRPRTRRRSWSGSRAARGACVVSQVSVGHKNAFELEVGGASRSLAWAQESPNAWASRTRDEETIVVRDGGEAGPGCHRCRPGTPKAGPRRCATCCGRSTARSPAERRRLRRRGRGLSVPRRRGTGDPLRRRGVALVARATLTVIKE